mgnify:CR=1 FL=1|jgi:GT2 family glycosyltransferase
MRFAVLMTCFNRKEKTINCLNNLFNCFFGVPHDFDVYLVDDASTDGTVAAVRSKFPSVNIINGSGDLYWNKGMFLAFEKALLGDYDYYFWLNDDTIIFDDSIKRMIYFSVDSYADRAPGIYVGSTCGSNGAVTYGGSLSSGFFGRFRYKKIINNLSIELCDVMNGNFVIINKEIVKKIGIIDESFEHAFGDIDYSLRARAAGFFIYLMPGVFGVCENNSIKNSFVDKCAKFSVRWRSLISKKGLPVKSWFIFTRRHGGYFWMLYFIWPYIKFLSSCFFRK